ncbi:hypothetical protein ABZT17_02915 [Streptomyces sp. NPDC005648]|uniref:hypothetical protein n=1 Tax=Streptomyces sp. NPDC005648 TaxID=3157044 RepID=UPI0033A4CDF6
MRGDLLVGQAAGRQGRHLTFTAGRAVQAGGRGTALAFPFINRIVSALRAAARSGAGLLDPDERALVHHAVREWDGSHPSAVLRGFPPRRELPGARLAPPAALAPYRITDEDVAARHLPRRDDERLVRLIAHGAFLSVGRIESALAVEVAGETVS